jgi:16S rRNA (guanine(966)-N(2))-methyltransferase RsmD
MRVIGGTARGRKLAAFAGAEIRPTPDRVREALFSMLYSRKGPLTGAKILDLFAGSGALGIEALSRGASHAWLVDNSREAVSTIRTNLEKCCFIDRATIIERDVGVALTVVAEAGPFAIIFADPPYSRDHAGKILEGIDRQGLLETQGLVCIETAAADPVPMRVGSLQHIDRRRYGLTMLHFYQHSNEDQA